MTKPETALVPFHGQQLLTIKDGDTIRVAMKPITEGIGLDWEGQRQRINRHPVLSTCAFIMQVQVPGDTQTREVVTLPLDYLNGWLFGIDTNRVKPEIRGILIEYQRECFSALAAYWQQGIATNPRARATTIPQLLSTHRHINSLHKALKSETNPPSRRMLHGQLEQVCRLISLECPALEDIGADAVPDHESPLLADFWETFDLLQHKLGGTLNHARNGHLIAFSMPQVRAAAFAAKLFLPDSTELRRVLKASYTPSFVGIKAVNSRQQPGKTIKCWVFATSRDTTGELFADL